uniref:Uncharacterized protein n=1 Tax=Oryza glaberrima TaxID=4538 RepID=I1QJN1_ORYGL
ARYWQHRCAHSSRVVPGFGKPGVTSRPSRFDYISSSASSSSTIAVIVSPSSSLACLRAPLVHDALLCIHDHSTAPHALPAARLPQHQLPDFGYIDHGYSTHGFIDHGSLGSFALATSTMAQRAIIRVEHSCRFLLQSKCPRCSRVDCGGMLEYMIATYSSPGAQNWNLTQQPHSWALQFHLQGPK